MGKNKQSLIEEINRIKSLFSEERLWGNLTESTDDECMDQLEASGYFISKPGSSSNDLTRQHLVGCLYAGGNKNNPTDLYRIYEKIKGESTNVKINIQERGSNCMLLFTNKSPCNGDELVGSIWEDPLSTWNLQVLYKFKDSLGGIPLFTSKQIHFFGWEGVLNPTTFDYNNFNFKGAYIANGAHIPGSYAVNQNSLKKYIGNNEMDDDEDGKNDLDTSVDTTHPNPIKDFLTDQTGIGSPTGNFIDDILKKTSGFCISGGAPWKRK